MDRRNRTRLGLFTLKSIKAGTELTFDYKFVRFGKDPQKCLWWTGIVQGSIGVSSDENSSKNPPGRKRKQLKKPKNWNRGEEIDEFEVFMESDLKFAELPGQIRFNCDEIDQNGRFEMIKTTVLDPWINWKYLCNRKFL